jgi:hypothetical protein
MILGSITTNKKPRRKLKLVLDVEVNTCEVLIV